MQRATAGEVYCWHFVRERPDAIADPRDVVDHREGPLRVPLPVPIMDMAVEGDHGCGAGRNSVVWCWNAVPGTPLRWHTWQHPWLRDVARLHQDLGMLCATLVDGRVVCDNTQRSNYGEAHTHVEFPGLHGAVQLAGECARFANGTVHCWGSSVLPIGRVLVSPTPLRVAVTEPFATLGLGPSYACGLGRSGSVWCWGAHEGYYDGTYPHPPVTPYGPPTHVEGLGAVTQLAVGAYQTCARLVDGSVTCFTPGETPHAVPNLQGVTEISAGNGHACALLADGTVRCWGNFEHAWPGHPRVHGAITPLDVRLPEPAVAIVSAGSEACARLRSGVHVCWGGGQGPGPDSATSHDELATLPLDPSDRVVPSATGGVACALTPDHTLRWGLRLAYGTHASASELVDQPAPTGVVGRSAQRLCTARENGTVHCMARSPGATGPSADTDTPLPHTVVQLATGDEFTCALDTDGAAWCWGRNDVGQLGMADASVVPMDAPALVMR